MENKTAKQNVLVTVKVCLLVTNISVVFLWLCILFTRNYSIAGPECQATTVLGRAYNTAVKGTQFCP